MSETAVERASPTPTAGPIVANDYTSTEDMELTESGILLALLLSGI